MSNEGLVRGRDVNAHDEKRRGAGESEEGGEGSIWKEGRVLKENNGGGSVIR